MSKFSPAPTRPCTRPNALIAFEGSPFHVNTRHRPWDAEALGERDVALWAAEAPGLLKIGLGEAALRADQFLRATGLDLVGRAETQQHVRE